MGRRPRIDFEGAWHHVMHRGAGRRTVYLDDEERRIFLRHVGELEQRFGLEVHAFVLMDNHFHLLIRSAEARLSEGMQWMLGNFTRWINARRGVDGAIFRGRFHGVNVVNDGHRHLLVRYLAENPLDLRPSVDPVAYEWSSVSSIASGRQVSTWPWLHAELVEEMYGPRVELLVTRLATRHPPTAVEGAEIVRPGETIDAQVERLTTAAGAAAGLDGAVERAALQVGAVLTLIDRSGRWPRAVLGDAVGLTPSAVASAVHRTRRASEQESAVARYVARVAEMAAVDEIPVCV